MRMLVLASAIVTAAPAAAQQAAPGLVLTESDAGRVVKLLPGVAFQVRLPQQAGTAYRWQLRRDPRIELAGPLVTENAAPAGVVGWRQYRVFTLRATADGRIPLVFALRSAAGGEAPAQQLVITLDVDGPDVRDAAVAGPLRESDAARVIDVAAGQDATIALPSNASTGYSWRLISARNAALAAPIAEQPDPQPRGMVGGGSTAIVHVHFGTPGAAEVVLGHVPPARGAKPKRQVRFRFRVNRPVQ